MAAHDPFLNREWATQQAVEDVDASSLADLSDVVSFLIPLTPETKSIIGREILDLMKRGWAGQREAVCGRLGAGITCALIRTLTSPIAP
jgi:hypothetical protein